MNNYIKKNILLDELVEFEITYNNDLLNIFEELQQSIDFKYDGFLLTNSINIIDNMIYESNEYLKSINNNNLELEYESFIISKNINNLYNAKYKIIVYLNSLNEPDILTDLIDGMNID